MEMIPNEVPNDPSPNEPIWRITPADGFQHGYEVEKARRQYSCTEGETFGITIQVLSYLWQRKMWAIAEES